MVAKSYIKSILRSVRHSFSRFAAIFTIVALGVGFLAGLLSTTPDMRHSVAVYYESSNFMDIQIMGNLGMCDADVNALRALPGVDGVMPAMTIDLVAATDHGDTLVLRSHVLDISAPESGDADHINRSVLIEGRWPESPDECVMEYAGEILGGLAVGNTITFTADNKDLEDTLSRTDFTVVGVVSTSYYLNMTQRGYTTVGNGRIGAIVHLPRESFATDYYTEIYLTLADKGQQGPFSQEYLTLADAMADSVETLSQTQKYVRRDAIRDDAEAELADAKATLDEKQAEAEAELADAKAELEDGEAELEDARRKLADGRKEYEQGVRDLAEGRETFETEIADAEQQIADGRAELEDALAELEDGQRQYDDGIAELEDNRPALEDGRQQLADAIAEFEAAERELEDGQRELDENRAKLDDGWAQMADALVQMEEGRQQLSDGKAALADAERQLADGRAQYEQGVQALDALDAALSATDNEIVMDTLEQLLGLAQGASPEEMVVYIQGYLSASEPLAEDIRARLADPATAAEVSEGERTYLELYDTLAVQAQDPDQLAQYLAQLQDDYQDAETVIAALRAERNALAAQLAEASAQLDEAAKLLADGRAQLSAGELAYSDGLRQYRDGVAELEDGEIQWQEGAQKLADGWAELEDNRPDLEAAVTEFADKEAEFLDAEAQLSDARVELEDGWRQYAEGLADLAQAELDLEEGRQTAQAEFLDAEVKLADALIEITDGEAELADGEVTLSDGWAEYYDGEAELDDKLMEARDEITAAEDKLRDMEAPKWYILTRESNPGYVSYKGDSEKIEAIVRVFPIFFFLVATLVASTTMTRMVEEERGNIGTLKALGYTNGTIAAKFFLYAAAAALLGSAAGLAIGLKLFPGVIYNAYGMMYNLPAMNAAQHAIYGSLSAGAIFVGIMFATAGALNSSLKENAASLMRPKAPPEGKRIFMERITPLWKRMKFTHKVTARNLIRYKKRFFMTVIGIFGCTALLLCGFGLRDSISDIVNIQFGEIFTYNLQVSLKHNGDHLTDRRISRLMDDPERVDTYIAVHLENVRLRAEADDPGTQPLEVSLMAVADTEHFADFVTLRDRKSGQPMPGLRDDAVYLSERAAQQLGLSVGDSVPIENGDEVTATLPVAGIVENYVQGYLYITGAGYEAAFGTPCEYTTLLAHAADATPEIRDTFSEALLRSPNVTGVSFTVTLKETFDEMLETIDYIVVVLIVSAGLLAFVVMYNLTNINITERIKELATIQVLGFTRLETASYIFRETTILAVVGALVGLGGGVFLHRFIITTVEVDNMMFGQIIKPISYILSFFITLAFSMIVNIMMTFKLKAINMAEALKAPE